MRIWDEKKRDNAGGKTAKCRMARCKVQDARVCAHVWDDAALGPRRADERRKKQKQL